MASTNLLTGLLALSGALLGSACYLTSSFDGLTGAPDGGTTSSSSGGGGMGGMAGAGGGSGGTGGTGGAGGMAGLPFPATDILDEFDGSGEDPGPSWELTEPGSYVVYSGDLIPTEPYPQAAIWSQPFGPRQEVFVTLDKLTGAEEEIELILRNQGHPSECDAVLVSFNRFSGTPKVEVTYCVNDDWTAVGAAVPLVLKDDDTIGARGYEDGRVEVFVNGALVGTWDASAAPMGTSGGRIGFYLQGLQEPIELDDFGGGSF